MFFNFRKKKEEKEEEVHEEIEEFQLDKSTEALVNRRTGLATIVQNGIASENDLRKKLELLAAQNKLPIFKGHVEHAYESDFLGYKHKCPNCGAPTEKMMSNFPYATQTEPRVLTAPAGHFCTKCPTVIIDDDMMKSGIDSRKFKYGGVYGVDTGYSDRPEMFRTLNGKKTIYIFDDFETVGGIAQSVHILQREDSEIFDSYVPATKSSPFISAKKKAKNKSKNKMAKKSRQQNRKK